MRSRVLILAFAAGGLLSVLAVVGALLSWWWLVVLSAMMLQSAILLVAADADRRVRDLRRFVRLEVARVGDQQQPIGPSEADVVGTVRALQAQYTGRLDRLQDAVEEVLRRDGRG